MNTPQTDELVACIAREDFLNNVHNLNGALFQETALEEPLPIYFFPKSEAENNDYLIQLCSYIIISQHDDSQGVKYLTYKRGSSGGESRLHAKYSIGIGGHLNKEDFKESTTLTFDIFRNACIRELEEELDFSLYSEHQTNKESDRVKTNSFWYTIKTEIQSTVVPSIFIIPGTSDAANKSVGNYHLGLGFIYRLPDMLKPIPKENCLESCELVTPLYLEILARKGWLEDWSKEIVDNYNL